MSCPHPRQGQFAAARLNWGIFSLSTMKCIVIQDSSRIYGSMGEPCIESRTRGKAVWPNYYEETVTFYTKKGAFAGGNSHISGSSGTPAGRATNSVSY